MFCLNTAGVEGGLNQCFLCTIFYKEDVEVEEEEEDRRRRCRRRRRKKVKEAGSSVSRTHGNGK